MQQLTLIGQALARQAAPVATSKRRHFDSGLSSEWYTPAEYIEAARATMGAIDLDPASCAMANRVVRAARFYDREANGLSQQWYGRVWVNPPYSDYKGQAAEWAARLLSEYRAGRVQQGVLLVNLSTVYQAPMQQLAMAGSACLVGERIRFYDATGEPQRSPTQANVLIYVGERSAAFSENFGRFGAVLKSAGRCGSQR